MFAKAEATSYLNSSWSADLSPVSLSSYFREEEKDFIVSNLKPLIRTTQLWFCQLIKIFLLRLGAELSKSLQLSTEAVITS